MHMIYVYSNIEQSRLQYVYLYMCVRASLHHSIIYCIVCYMIYYIIKYNIVFVNKLILVLDVISCCCCALYAVIASVTAKNHAARPKSLFTPHLSQLEPNVLAVKLW